MFSLTLEETFRWLSREGFTRAGHSYEPDWNADGDNTLPPDSYIVFGLPCTRSEKKKKEELNAIKKDKGQAFAQGFTESTWQAIWQEFRNPKETVRRLDINRMSADALAFYRPFHFPPFG